MEYICTHRKLNHLFFITPNPKCLIRNTYFPFKIRCFEQQIMSSIIILPDSKIYFRVEQCKTHIKRSGLNVS